jgi:hypothetical protein
MPSPIELKDIAGEVGLERASHAAKLAPNQILGDALPTHSLRLDVELVLQIASACLWIYQGSVR